MNFYELINPDNAVGQTLLRGRAWLHAGAYLLRNPSLQDLSLLGAVLRVQPRHTMLSTARLASLYQRAREIEAAGVPGDIVECGVWNGGSAAIMAKACPARNMWLFDSFQGLPQPTECDGRPERERHFDGFCKGDEQRVREAFRKFGLPLHNVHIVPGWFEDTFPSADIEEIALLHIDADWYEPVKLVLETFYERVAPGGVVAVDDYGIWEGCKRAFDEFWETRSLPSPSPSLTWVDKGAVYFLKPE